MHSIILEKKVIKKIFIKFLGDSFSIIESEIYYNISKKEIVYNCDTRDKEVIKDGLRYAFVNYDTQIMNKEELKNYNIFLGNEFLITNKKQILPLYEII